MSLKNKIFVFNFVVFFMGLCLFSIFNVRYVNERLLTDYVESSQQETNMIRNNLDILLESTEDYLRILSTAPEFQKTMRAYSSGEIKTLLDEFNLRNALGREVSNLIYPNTKVEGAVIWGENDKILYAGYDIEEAGLYESVGREYLEKVEKEQKALWGDMMTLPRISGDDLQVFPCSKVIIDKESGKRLGKLTFFLPEEEIQNVYKTDSDSEINYIILDIKDTIISSENKKILGKDIESLDQEVMSRISNMLNHEKALVEKGTILTIENYEKMNWKIIRQGTTAEYEYIRNNIVRNTIILFLVIGGIVFWGAYTVSRRITKPLYSLIDTMKTIRSGNLEARAQHFEQQEVEVLAEEFNNLMERLNLLMDQIYEHQKTKRIYELKLLMEQLKPHFLYNSLETVVSLVKIDYKEKAVLMIRALSDFYRKSLNGGSEIVTVRDEIEIIKNYLLIQRIRYERYMEYEIEVSEEILNFKIPKLILQPLVENALYHGIKQGEKKADLIVRGYKDGKDAVLEIFDSGVGIEPEKLKEIQKKLREQKTVRSDEVVRNSFGIYSVNERIRLYYGDKYGITLESMIQEYTQVTIRIPDSEGGTEE